MKPGIKSTEFLFNILSVLGVTALELFTDAPTEVTISILGLAGLYTGGRSWVKRKG